MRKILFCFNLVLFFQCQAQLSLNDFLGLWDYEYSLDSSYGQWVSYLEHDAQVLDDYYSSNVGVGDEVNGLDDLPSFNSQEDFSYPLFLIDQLFTVRFVKLSEDNLKVNFLEYPTDPNYQFAFTDRTAGFVRLNLLFEEDKTYLNVYNDSEEKVYKILEYSKDGFTLLDESANTKHIFKRK